jgi:beta-glucosidase
MKRRDFIKRSAVSALLPTAVGRLANVNVANKGAENGHRADENADQRVEDLLSQMTLTEKVGQLTLSSGTFDSGVVHPEQKALIREGKLGSLLFVRGAKATNEAQRIAVEESRLKIPLLFGLDVIHGYKTIFPIPLAEAASWDPDIAKRSAAVSAKEAAAAGVRWTFAPMVDIARDPRWGRAAEGSGEDPFLGAALASARVHGFQGNDLSDPSTVLACVKHFVAYGAAEAGRDYNSVDVSEKSLREIYFPPFKAALDAGVGSVMSSFNDLNGLPSTANKFLLTEVLRNEWGFKGVVVSDWNSVGELIAHGLAGSASEAAQAAMNAGVDIDMEGGAYAGNLAALVKQGSITETAIDNAVRRVLQSKFALGLFERPYADEKREQVVMLSQEHLSEALDVARKSIVLLKNDRDILPLKKETRTIAVIGPLADNKKDPLGCWSAEGQPSTVVTVLDGIKRKVATTTKILHEQGCAIEGAATDGFAAAVSAARAADVAILVVGEAASMSGEAASRAYLDLPGVQGELVKAIHQTGTPLVLVLMNGRPLTISWEAENVPAILETWFLGVRSGDAIADVLFGDFNPGGRLPITFPRTVGQIPLYYNHKSTGRPSSDKKDTSRYLDLPVTPLFPFGHGLSFTKFAYSNLVVSKSTLKVGDGLSVSVDVQNVGQRTGDEVVQLYLQDIVASMTRPVKELKGFKRITLQPSEKRTVQFLIGPQHLGFYDRAMHYIVEPGTFKVWVGGSSVEGLEASFKVVETKSG